MIQLEIRIEIEIETGIGISNIIEIGIKMGLI